MDISTTNLSYCTKKITQDDQHSNQTEDTWKWDTIPDIIGEQNYRGVKYDLNFYHQGPGPLVRCKNWRGSTQNKILLNLLRIGLSYFLAYSPKNMGHGSLRGPSLVQHWPKYIIYREIASAAEVNRCVGLYNHALKSLQLSAQAKDIFFTWIDVNLWSKICDGHKNLWTKREGSCNE